MKHQHGKLTVREIAASVNVSESSVRRWIADTPGFDYTPQNVEKLFNKKSRYIQSTYFIVHNALDVCTGTIE